jgi:asparagine synthetase B (glutamine-hydrolysing)
MVHARPAAFASSRGIDSSVKAHWIEPSTGVRSRFTIALEPARC